MKLESRDFLRYFPPAQRLYGLATAARAETAGTLTARLDRLADAYRMLLGADRPEWIEWRVRPFVEDPLRAPIWREAHIGSHPPDQTAPLNVTKGVVLKAPGRGGERGVMLLSFEYNWPPVIHYAKQRDELLGRYTILCAPSWSPTHFQSYWSWAHLPRADVLFMIACASDIDAFHRLDSGTDVVPFHGCDWNNPHRYHPRPHAEREIDILMVANWATFKRHWVLFKALRDIARPLRVVLVGQPEQDRTVDDVRREAALYGVAERVELRDSLSLDEVATLQCNSKVQLVLSRREGYCNCAAEAFLADTPVGLVHGTHMGPASYIRADTGVLLDERHLGEQLCAFLDRAHTFRPRAWALHHCNCFTSTRRLNALLRRRAEDRHEPWREDLAVLEWHGNPRYAYEDERLRFAAVYRELEERHAVTFQINRAT